MPSENVHFKQIVASEEDIKKLQSTLRSSPHKYDADRGTGFVMSKVHVLDGFSSRLVFPKTVRTKKVDPNDLTSFEFLTEEWHVNYATDIEFDFKRGLSMLAGQKSGYKVVAEKFDEIEDLAFSFADVDVDVVGVYNELKKNFKKSAVKAITVKNYVDEHGYISNATFKADAVSAQTDKFVDEYGDKIKSMQFQIFGDVPYVVKFDRKGTVGFSIKSKEEALWPEYMYPYMADLIKHFNSIGVSDVAEPEQSSEEVEGEESSHLKLVGVA